MTRSHLISYRFARNGLSGFALGLSLCLGQGGASAADAQVDQDRAAAVAAQTDNLRSLFEAAGRTGLVDLKTLGGEHSQADEASELARPAGSTPDCDALAPLLDSAQEKLRTGLFTELATDWPETAELASSLTALIDPTYDGTPLPVDLRRSVECGASFMPWTLLSDPARPVTATEAATLTKTLQDMDPALRRLVGVQIGTRSGLAGQTRLTRRIADTLTDSGLHGQTRHRRDPDHVLMDAILLIEFDPVGARTRLAWLAERDGPEQLVAIDLLRGLDAAPAARSELKRLAQSPDTEVRVRAEQRLLDTAIADADIRLVSEMIAASPALADNQQNRERLAERLAHTLETGDALSAVQAMAVIDRLAEEGVNFGPDLATKRAFRIERLVSIPDVENAQTESPTVAETGPAAPQILNGPDLTNYLGALDADLETFREVLNHG